MLKDSQKVTRDEHANIGGVDGKKVFVIDGEANQIIDFVNPTANVTVEQGTNPWLSKVTDGTTDLYLWSSGAISTVNAVHWRIRESKEWFTNYRFDGVLDDASAYIQIATGAKSSHGHIFACSDGKMYFELFENPTLHASGATVTSYCMNREVDATPITAFLSTPSVDTDGIRLENGILGSAGKFTAAGGDLTDGYWLLKPNEDYLIKATNKSGGAIDVCIKYQWHEHVAVT